MSDIIGQHENGNGAVTGTFAEVALAALKARKVTNICRECGRAEGWADWEVAEVPVFLPLLPPAQGGAPLLLLMCRRCGAARTFALAYLGLQIEQRRIVTPDAGTFH